ncbi:hypothetical protein AB1N83_000800 [Pleurotus pulmonarius]
MVPSKSMPVGFNADVRPFRNHTTVAPPPNAGHTQPQPKSVSLAGIVDARDLATRIQGTTAWEDGGAQAGAYNALMMSSVSVLPATRCV